MLDQSVTPGAGVLILRPAKRRFLVLLLISVGLTVAGAVGVSQNPLVGWLVTGFFALCTLVFLIQLIPGASYLRLTPDGFEMRSLFRKWPPFPWSKVSEFRVIPAGRTELVVFNAELDSRMARINHAAMGATNGLPDTYGMKADRLADLMNAWRSTAVKSLR